MAIADHLGNRLVKAASFYSNDKGVFILKILIAEDKAIKSDYFNAGELSIN